MNAAAPIPLKPERFDGAHTLVVYRPPVQAQPVQPQGTLVRPRQELSNRSLATAKAEVGPVYRQSLYGSSSGLAQAPAQTISAGSPRTVPSSGLHPLDPARLNSPQESSPAKRIEARGTVSGSIPQMVQPQMPITRPNRPEPIVPQFSQPPRVRYEARRPDPLSSGSAITQEAPQNPPTPFQAPAQAGWFNPRVAEARPVETRPMDVRPALPVARQPSYYPSQSYAPPLNRQFSGETHTIHSAPSAPPPVAPAYHPAPPAPAPANSSQSSSRQEIRR